MDRAEAQRIVEKFWRETPGSQAYEVEMADLAGRFGPREDETPREYLDRLASLMD